MNQTSRVSIVIPNYNGAVYLRDCLDAVRLQNGEKPRVIVVDNGSEDDSLRLLAEEYPEVELIRFESNTGFCGAVNAGITASEEQDYVILLNNDTVVDPDFTRALTAAMDADPRIFSAQAKMVSMQDPSVIDDAGNYYCALGWAFARGKGKKDGDRYNRPRNLFSCCAGAAIYRKCILDEIGLFDENHFAYLEDTDIGWRARIAGYRNVYAPQALVRHVGSASSGSIYNLFKVRNSSRNSVYIIGKNMPLLQVIVNLPLLVPGFLVKALFFARKGWGKEYIAGVRKGFALSRQGKAEGRKVRFKWHNLPHYLKIQWELWVAIVRRAAAFFC
ncbi:MAG: glycosyltransferase family 2 protein [Lachnospiraceae bacterium]|nr:glycosyltransferase family 2 protein [Lachnospiraceae bacterium]